jgi:hypothetical protein
VAPELALGRLTGGQPAKQVAGSTNRPEDAFMCAGRAPKGGPRLSQHGMYRLLSWLRMN